MLGLILRFTGDVHVGEIGVGSGEVLRDVRRRGCCSFFGLVSWLVRWVVVLVKRAGTGKLGFRSGYSFENAHSKRKVLAGFMMD
jgi:hypothetical protein